MHRIPGAKSIRAWKAQIERWLTVQAETARHTQPNVTTPPQKGIAGRAPLWLLGVSIGLTVVAAIRSAYGLTIVFFGIAAVFAVLVYQSFRDSIRAPCGLRSPTPLWPACALFRFLS